MANPNLSLNGVAGTLWEIRRQENVHPYLGLRQAVLIINAQEKALREGRLAQKKAALALKNQKQSARPTGTDEVAIFLSEIEIAEHELAAYDQLILDAETELNAAKEEKTRIEYLNPSMASETYEGLQIKYAQEAFQCKLARAVVISAYSSHKTISEGAAEVIYDAGCLSQSDRERFEGNVIGQIRQLLPENFPPPESIPSQSVTPINGGSNGISVERN